MRFPIYGDSPNNMSARPHIRPSRMLFNENSHFIAYYKTGACEELAILFNKTTSEAGFKSRIVRTTAEDHAWNEVYIDDQWVHVDPTLYYHYSTGEYPSYEGIWYDHPSAYSELGWHGGYSKILVDDGTKEDVSSRYANVGNVSVSFLEPTDRIKVKPIGANRYSFEDNIEGFQYVFDIGYKDYSITAEKDVIPYLLVKQDTKNFTVVENTTIRVELS
ncbi:transglutaminase domain-containing protein, partial [Methanoculleus sp. MH98A]|uniref:transglutaminase domain-containing protein n=1 Tax=Methanoculleus sp. MH98A TaxID=1495314 RepID=UPI001E2C0A7E